MQAVCTTHFLLSLEATRLFPSTAFTAPSLHARTEAPDSDDSKTYNGYRETNWKWLDHIFYRGATAKVYRVEDSETKYGVRFISDHFPIWCDFDVAL